MMRAHGPGSSSAARSRLMVMIACLLLICPAAAISYTNEMHEWVDTGGRGYAYTNSYTYYNSYNQLYFTDITRASTLNYVAFDYDGGQMGSWTEGTHALTYTLDGVERRCTLHVDYSRNFLGQITHTRHTLFFDDWDIGDLIGPQYVTLNASLFNTLIGTGSLIYNYNEGDNSYVWIRNPTQWPGIRYTSTVSSGIDWTNRITITDNYGGSDLNVALQREYGTEFYGSTLNISGPSGSLYSSFGTTDVSLFYLADSVDMVTVTSPSGQVYSYPKSLYSGGEPEYTPLLYGEVVDLYTGLPIANAIITATQPAIGRTFTTTSDAAGEYAISPGPVAGHPITISASADNYSTLTLSFDAVPKYSSWHILLFLVPGTSPDLPTEPGESMLYGYVITQGSQQPIQGATVTLSDGSSTTTTSTGFYVFNNVTPGDYTITASAPYHTSVSESVSLVADTATQHNLALEGTYTLTVTVKDANDLNPVPGTTIILSDGQTATNQNPATFEVEYGQYTVSVAAEGYYPGTQFVYIERTGATTATVMMTAVPSSPELPNYPPHNVKFTVLTLLGTPIPGVNVTAQGIEQTPSTNILERMLGINTISTPITSEVMSGTTDSNGEINFMMIEAVKYRITLTKPPDVNKTIDIYPKEDTYPIIISTTSGPLLPAAGDALRAINISVTTSTDEDLGHIHVDYNDTTLKTTYLSIVVSQQNTTNTSAPEEIIDSYSVSNDANVTHTFDLTDCKGQSYFVRIEATHPDFGTVHRDYAVAFKGIRVPLGPIPDDLYIYVSGLLLLLIGSVFTASSATRGVVAVALSGWLFYGFGWLDELGPTGPVCLSLVTVLAVLGIIVTRYREEGYS